MIWLFLATVATVVAVLIPLLKEWKRDPFEAGMFSFISGMIFGFVSWFLALMLANATTGALPNYSHGTRDGYLTKVSQVGVVWKTWEGQIQVGTGNMAALQEPWAFSVRDPQIVRALTDGLGSHVRLNYREWLIQPWRYGATDYEVVGIEFLAAKAPAEQ